MNVAISPVATSNLAADLDRACARIAPLWSLQDFVAVNPFLGLAEQPFDQACDTMARVAGAEMLMPRAFYRAALADGRITDADLAAAIGGAPGITPATLRALAQADRPPVAATVQTFADLCGVRRLMIDEIGKTCAAWCDQGQAAWPMPGREARLWDAWRATAALDATPEVAGLRGFRARIAALPQDPCAAAADARARLGTQGDDDYLHRVLLDVGGWAAWMRQRGWHEADDALRDLLCIRLAWDAALHALHPRLHPAWAARPAAAGAGLAADAMLQSALEHGWQRGLVDRLLARAGAVAAPARPAAQAAFCIDVRSEVFRRALEATSADVATIGFAGFFGFAIEYVPLGDSRGAAQCPVLLTPGVAVCEAVGGASPADQAGIVAGRAQRRRLAAVWDGFRQAAVSCFAHVEATGLLFAGKLARASLGRAAAPAGAAGLDPAIFDRLEPSIAPGSLGARATGFTDTARLDAAEAVLRAMSMTGNFARLVLLCGHGSSSANNPHAAGLDCGACGGHSGQSNARVAAAIMNDPKVRTGLVPRGITIPEDTVFLGALHDTTTDALTLFGTAPESHAPDMARLRGWLAQATAACQAARAPALGLAAGPGLAAALVGRSRDWSEVRPEWGLANNAAFIAAPRARTQALDLGGRAFLHSYDWQQDAGFGVLALIMTAPMVVANWINLGYYGAVVDNAAFGSGNKVLHNVVGRFGVLEGQGGDLRVGLPWQSVHDGVTLRHDPLRLSVFIEAPEAAMNDVLRAHPAVRQLLDNGWLHLFSIADEGRVIRRYRGALAWE